MVQIQRVPFPLLTGIAIGQLIAYLLALPKIKLLQEEVKTILENET